MSVSVPFYTAVSVPVWRGLLSESLMPNGVMPVWVTGKINFKAKWRFLGQAFAGAGIYLNDNWQLTIGYRLRYLSGNATWKMVDNGANRVEFKMKQDIVHAAEVGITYRF